MSNNTGNDETGSGLNVAGRSDDELFKKFDELDSSATQSLDSVVGEDNTNMGGDGIQVNDDPVLGAKTEPSLFVDMNKKLEEMKSEERVKFQSQLENEYEMKLAAEKKKCEIKMQKQFEEHTERLEIMQQQKLDLIKKHESDIKKLLDDSQVKLGQAMDTAEAKRMTDLEEQKADLDRIHSERIAKENEGYAAQRQQMEDNHQSVIDKLEMEYHKKIEEVRTEMKTRENKMKEENKGTIAEFQMLMKEQATASTKEKEVLEEAKKKEIQELNEVKTDLEAQVTCLTEKNNQLGKELIEGRKTSQADEAKLREEYEVKMQDQFGEHTERLEIMQQQKLDLIKKHESDIKKIVDDSQVKLGQAMDAAEAKRLSEMNKQKADLDKIHDERIVKEKEGFAAQRQQMEDNHQSVIDNLKMENEKTIREVRTEMMMIKDAELEKAADKFATRISKEKEELKQKYKQEMDQSMTVMKKESDEYKKKTTEEISTLTAFVEQKDKSITNLKKEVQEMTKTYEDCKTRYEKFQEETKKKEEDLNQENEKISKIVEEMKEKVSKFDAPRGAADGPSQDIGASSTSRGIVEAESVVVGARDVSCGKRKVQLIKKKKKEERKKPAVGLKKIIIEEPKGKECCSIL